MTDSNVIDLDIPTKNDLPSEKVLRGALESEVEGVIVMGYDSDGEEYFSSASADAGELLWLIERCKAKILGLADAPD